MNEGLRIVGLFTAAAFAYAVVQNQVTARVCVEYFSVGHPAILPTRSSALLGLFWALVAGAPAGAFCGTLVAMGARDGPGPRLDWRYFVAPVRWLALVMALSTLLAGLAGYVLTSRGVITVIERYRHLISPDRHARFMADVFGHGATFLVGLLGTLLIAVRGRLHRMRRPG